MIDKGYIEFIRKTCRDNGWKKDWSHGGCYIHLEVSEFIEAIRGKGASPEDELGDVLFTLLAVADYYGVDIDKAIDINKTKHANRLANKFLGQ